MTPLFRYPLIVACTPMVAAWLGFAAAIAPCAAPACDGVTARLVGRSNPSEAYPGFGGAAGGFEVYIPEGYAHLAVFMAGDEVGNEVIGPLLDFIERHLR